MNPRVLLRALRFDDPRPEKLSTFGEAEWRRLLEVADREHLTLVLRQRCPSILPAWVLSRIDQNLANNSERFARLKGAYEEAAGALRDAGLEVVVLKGFSHGSGYSDDVRLRPQNDLDLFCRPADVLPARDVLMSLGYEPLSGFESFPIDHLPSMIRKTGWRWRGDFYDVDTPIAIELHFRLWDAGTERIELPGMESFWDRRTARSLENLRFLSLDAADAAGYAALHLLRHVLRGDVRLYHAYELARLLETTADDRLFWENWRRNHSERLRSIEALGFGLAAEWFGCRLPAEVRQQMESQPEPIRRWFSLFADGPIDSKARPNKNEIWLHLSLLETAADKRAVLTRRLLPLRYKQTYFAAHVPDSKITPRLRLARAVYRLRFAVVRSIHHLRSALPTLMGGARWWWSGKGLDPQFPRFVAAASLFNFGMSIFFLLYNLFLLERGFHEDTLGSLSSAASIGSIAGSLPAALVLQRFGLTTTLVAAFLGVSTMCAMRALFLTPALLIVSSFAGGFLFSFYAVALAPAVARLTNERSRTFGFSLIFSLGIGIGALAGVVGGRLPALLGRGHGSTLQPALFIACAVAASGGFAALRLRAGGAFPREHRIYPRGPFTYRFLLAVLIWNLATGAFNPFFGPFFAQALHLTVDRIGLLYSAAQSVQVVAVLAAPLVLRRFGIITGIACMQFTTAIFLGTLSLAPSGLLAGAIYAGYMAFQYMSEPGLSTVLMEGVAPEERSGASALNFVVAFGGQAVAAALAGLAVRRVGYSALLAVAATAALIAGVFFRTLLGPRFRSAQESRSLDGETALP